MLEFEILQDLESNAEILEIINDNEYIVKNGKIKHLKATNLQFIEPTEYLITYLLPFTILEYKVNEVANKNFYIKECHQKYNLKEIKQIKYKNFFLFFIIIFMLMLCIGNG